MMKKALSLVLCTLLVLPFLFQFAGAIGLTAGTEALNAQFTDGEYNEHYDYVSFSPVEGEADTAKYPLLVWLHGTGHSLEPRAQLNNYEFSNFASDEYQSRFADAGGCFLLAPRVADTAINAWDSMRCTDLKGIIDAFVAANSENIDTDRIYIAGYSSGGSMVWDMVTAYPKFFAAAAPLAAITYPADTTLNKLTDVSIWVFASDNDFYRASKTAEVRPVFQYLAGISNRPESLRMTSFSDARFADNTKLTNDNDELALECEHYIWESFTYDMFMADGVTPYAYATTIDGKGQSVSLETPGIGVIDWLSRQQKGDEDAPVVVPNFFERVMMIFRMVFDLISEFFRDIFNR